jgi:hypothetical protein
MRPIAASARLTSTSISTTLIGGDRGVMGEPAVTENINSTLRR